MTMLPIPTSELANDKQLFVVIANSSDLATRLFPIFAGETIACDSLAVIDVTQQRSLVFASVDHASEVIVESSDGVLFLSSAHEGISQRLIELWHLCIDNDIPRHLVITDLYSGYADFDEMLAIAHRTLEADLIARYIPMADDNAEEMAGTLDLLTGLIWDFSDKGLIKRDSDPEHVELTKDDRSRLLDAIAIKSFSDEELSCHQSGLLLPLEKYLTGWTSSHIKSASPLEEIKGLQFVTEWFNSLSTRWFPDVTSTTTTVPSRFGLGVTNGFARMWGTQSSSDLVCTTIGPTGDVNSHIISANNDSFAACLVDESITANSALVPVGEKVELIAPVF